ncbi:MAG: glycosyltransferase [Candidatus Kariarchaeaceae archaeon]|jgi:chlorobactene glucosyltransferase
MNTLFLPGFGASDRDFVEYSTVFENLVIVRYEGCLTVEDHLNAIDAHIQKWEQKGEDYTMIGHSLGGNLLYRYINSRELTHLKGASLVGAAPRFYPLNTWDTIFSKPSWFVGLVLFFIALGAPFLFIVYGWHGMFQRVNVIDLFRRKGVEYVKQQYNSTLTPLTEDPEALSISVPIQMIRLPNDLLVPDRGIEEALNLIPQLEITVIPRDLIHFSHHLDVLVVGYIATWLQENGIISNAELPFDTQYAMNHPDSVQVQLEDGFSISRRMVLPWFVVFLLIQYVSTFPSNMFSRFVHSILSDLFSALGWSEISYLTVLLLLILTFTFLRLYLHVITLPNIGESQTRVKQYPMVSIIIPARNEERNIVPCLESLIDLKYPNYEIIVVDGQSDDTTFALSQKTLTNSSVPHKVLVEPDLPEGWIGKSWGCWNGVQQASGEYFLFTDADTQHSQSSLIETMSQSISNGLDGISVIGNFQTITFWERAMLPFFKVLLSILFLGRYNVYSNRVLAIGQYILVKAEVYHSFGGHDTIRNEIAEDIHLAGKISQSGYYRAFSDNRIYSVRMYQSLSEIREGLSRNAFESVGGRLSLVIVASLGLIAWRIAPLFLVPFLYTQVLDPLLRLVLALYLLFTILLYIVEMDLNESKRILGILSPIGLIVLLGILLNASWKSRSDQPRIWKNRLYT